MSFQCMIMFDVVHEFVVLPFEIAMKFQRNFMVTSCNTQTNTMQ